MNALSLTPDRHMIAAAGYQHIRMFDLTTSNPNCVVNYDGIAKNVTSVGFHEDGHWMYTGGEDNSARVWDLRSRNLQCSRIFQVSLGSLNDQNENESWRVGFKAISLSRLFDCRLTLPSTAHFFIQIKVRFDVCQVC